MKYKTLNLLEPIQLYINGKWVDVLPVCKQELNLFVKNIDEKQCPLIDYKNVDLYWHFTVAEGKQIRNVNGNVKFSDKVKFILRSWL